MDWKSHLEKIRSKKVKKPVKIKAKNKFLFKHRFLTQLEKTSRRKATRLFAPFPVLATKITFPIGLQKL